MNFPQQNIRFNVLKAKFSGNVRIRECRILYTFFALQIKSCIHQIRGQVKIFIRHPQFFQKFGKFFSCHAILYSCSNAK